MLAEGVSFEVSPNILRDDGAKKEHLFQFYHRKTNLSVNEYLAADRPTRGLEEDIDDVFDTAILAFSRAGLQL